MKQKKRIISTLLLTAYSALLVKVLVFKNVPPIRIGPLMFKFGGPHEGPANLVPFKTILTYLLGGKGFIISFINLAGNIVLLVPWGFIVPFIFRNITWKKSLPAALAAGFTIEGMQAVLHVGIFDVDDVMLNGLGVMAGYWLFTILSKMELRMKYNNIVITAVIIVAAMVVLYEAIVSKNTHLPVSVVNSAPRGQPGSTARLDTAKGVILQGADPCNGTGGTGQIVSLGNNTITIKRNDGINETIKLTNKTRIKNSSGPLPKSGLKTGDRVTVVVMLNDTATMVAVCNTAGRGAGK